MKLGIIGFGNMAEAILAGILAKGFIRVQDVIVSRRSKDKLEETASKYGVAVTTDNKKVAKEADVIIPEYSECFSFLPGIKEIKSESQKDILLFE